MISLKSLLSESPLDILGSDWIAKKVDRNAMHVHKYLVYFKHSGANEGVFLGGVDVEGDAIKYAKAYFDTHTSKHAGHEVYVIRQHDSKKIKTFSK